MPDMGSGKYVCVCGEAAEDNTRGDRGAGCSCMAPGNPPLQACGETTGTTRSAQGPPTGRQETPRDLRDPIIASLKRNFPFARPCCASPERARDGRETSTGLEALPGV